ncbi:MAG TPA: hypothetical protein VH255_02030 [Verrucomicrobiae bacterium]|nr:hypothetical protein [Verrucomicrobiae bacterium]
MLKDLAAAFMIFCGIPAFAALFCFWKGGRKYGFFLIVISAVYTTHMDLNLVSREWYRGSTRGFEISCLDILSAGLLIAMVLRPARGSRKWYWPAGFFPMVAYLAVCLCSVTFSDPKLFGMFEVLKVIRGFMMFMTAALFVQSRRELKVLVWGLACIVCWEGLLSLKMRYLGGLYRIQGSFDHPNSLSMFMILCAPILYASAVSKWSDWLRLVCFCGVGLASAAVIMTVSRTGVVTIGTVLFLTALACFSFKLNWQNIVITVAVLGALSVGVIYAWPTLMARFNGTSEEYSEKSAMNRGSYLRLAKLIRSDHFFGIGLNNWSYWVSNEYGPMIGLPYTPYEGTDWPPDQEVHSGVVDPSGQPLDDAQAPPAHNLPALTVGELGYPGILVFGFLWLRWLQMGSVFLLNRPIDPLRRIGLGMFFGTVAVAFQSWTEWEYRQTPIMFIFLLVLGGLAGLYKIRKDDIRWERAERRREREMSQHAPA